MVEKLEYTKFEERLDWAISKLKEKAKQEGLEFTEALFIQSVEIAKTLFVRSEIQYSGKKS